MEPNPFVRVQETAVDDGDRGRVLRRDARRVRNRRNVRLSPFRIGNDDADERGVRALQLDKGRGVRFPAVRVRQESRPGRLFVLIDDRRRDAVRPGERYPGRNRQRPVEPKAPARQLDDAPARFPGDVQRPLQRRGRVDRFARDDAEIERVPTGPRRVRRVDVDGRAPLAAASPPSAAVFSAVKAVKSVKAAITI